MKDACYWNGLVNTLQASKTPLPVFNKPGFTFFFGRWQNCEGLGS